MSNRKPGRQAANPESKERQPTSPAMTSEEAAIFERVKAETKNWTGVTEADIEDFSLMEDPFKLPPEAQKKRDKKELAFRWAEMKPQRIDELRNMPIPAKWWVANRTTTPFLEYLVDPIHGGIQRLDQILMVKPYWMHEAYQNKKMELAEIKDTAGDVEKRHGIKEEWGEWISDERAKVGKSDEVMADEADFDTSSGITEDGSDLGELVVEE